MTKVKGGREYFFALILAVMFVAGICMGAVFCAYANADTDESLYVYLEGFFEDFTGGTDNMAVAGKAAAINIRMFVAVLLAGFFPLGYIISGGCVIVKGFVMGFTAAALIKYYGTGGIWLAMCNFPSGLVLIPTLLFFTTISVGMSKNPNRQDRRVIGIYIVMSAAALALFILAAFVDGYATTALMKFALENAIK